MRRRLVPMILIPMGALLFAGCGAIFAEPVTVTQPTGLGALEVTVKLCSSGATDPKICEASDGDGGRDQTVRALLGLQVPATASLPQSVEATVTGLPVTTMVAERNPSFETALNSEQAPPAGMKWVGYVTPSFRDVVGVATTGRATFSIPLAADLPRDVRIQATVSQASDEAGPVATDPVVCNLTRCIIHRSPGGPTDYLTYRWRSLTLAPAPGAVTVQPGGTATLRVIGTFTGTPFTAPATVAATTTMSGVQLTHPGSVGLTREGTFDYLIQVAVPSSAPVGPSNVTATVTVPGGDTVTTTVPFTVEAAPPPPSPTCPTRPRFNSIIFSDGVTSFYYRPLPGQEILGARRFGPRLSSMLRTPQGRSRLPRVEYTTDVNVNAARLPWFARKVGPRRVITAIMANADSAKYSGIRLAYRPKRGTYAKLILPDGNVRTLQAGCPKVTGYKTIYAQNIFVQRTSKQ